MPDQKVILITGASSGFGREAALTLVRKGHRVFGTSRSQRPDEAGIRMLALDVRNDESVAACAKQVLDEAGRIDVLVNNAGYALTGMIEESTIEQVRDQFDTNVFGVVRMTRAVLPAMRSRRSGTIINVGSLAGLVGVPGEGFYAATKFTLEGYSESLRYEVAGFGIHVSIVEPSYFRTGFDTARAEAADRIDDYNGLRERIMAAFEKSARSGEDPRKVGDLIANIAESPAPRLRYRVGREARFVPYLRRLLPDAAFEWGAKRFFNLPGHKRD